MGFHDSDTKEMPFEGDDTDDDNYPPHKRTAEDLLAASKAAGPVKPGDLSFPWPSHEKRAILSWGMSMGAPNVPSLYKLNKIHKLICKQVGSPTKKIRSSSSTIFHINDIANAIALDYSDHLTCKQMEDYPSILGNSMSEASHGNKILNLPEHLTTLTVRVGGIIYWTKELVQCQSGKYFIPEHFFYYQDELTGKTELTSYSWDVIHTL
ncbi:hypothetical protein FRB95_008878, partial [Tulasnella sp. JGI-2019a]